MKKSITIYLAFFSTLVFAQNDFNAQMQKIADSVSKKIIQSGNKKVAIAEFINLDENVTQLGQFLCDELTSELANFSDNMTRFEVIERSNLNTIIKEKKLIRSADGSKMARMLGEIKAADVLIWAIISDFEGYYRVNLKLLDTKTGNALHSFKAQFIKTPGLENFNKKTIYASGAVESDRDKDGVNDDIDKCPDIFGYSRYMGCPIPDTDKDGVNDEEDKCVNMPGPASNFGCPVNSDNNANNVEKKPCERNLVGNLNITNTFSRLGGTYRIVVRIPKVANPNQSLESDYYFVTLSPDETKTLVNLKEGTLEYEAREFSSGSDKGWNPSYGSLSTGQVLIEKCKTAELLVK